MIDQVLLFMSRVVVGKIECVFSPIEELVLIYSVSCVVPRWLLWVVVSQLK